MGFVQSKEEDNIWMCEGDGVYKCIAVCVDDLLIDSWRDPKAIVDTLQEILHGFQLKGIGPLTYHLGCEFFRDTARSDGTLFWTKEVHCKDG